MDVSHIYLFAQQKVSLNGRPYPVASHIKVNGIFCKMFVECTCSFTRFVSKLTFYKNYCNPGKVQSFEPKNVDTEKGENGGKRNLNGEKRKFDSQLKETKITYK